MGSHAKLQLTNNSRNTHSASQQLLSLLQHRDRPTWVSIAWLSRSALQLRKKIELENASELMAPGHILRVCTSLFPSKLVIFTKNEVPSLPASRSSNARQRAEETPSHPGGLSEAGRIALEAHRRRREHNRGELASFAYVPLSDFPQRASRRIKKGKQIPHVASTTFNAVPTAIALGGAVTQIGK